MSLKSEKLNLLTPRENEILNLLLTNHSNRQIEEKIFIDYETIRSHRKSIYRKLEVKTILDLVMTYYLPIEKNLSQQ
jgi:two-component system, LuxR family, response regulator FixJ